MAKTLYRRMFHSSILVDHWIYIDGGEASYEEGNFFPLNETLGIDLSADWTNSTLNLTSVPRPPASLALNWQRLWWDKRQNVVYCFGGEISFGLEAAKNYSTPLSAIWGFAPDGEGGGAWAAAIGPMSDKPFPSNILCPAGGVSAYDDFEAYYVGGFIDGDTSIEVYVPDGETKPQHGLLTFNFESSALSNTSDGGYEGFYYPSGMWAGPGTMLNVPTYGIDGILVIMGGAGSFNNITIFDKHTHSWLSQKATGYIPPPRSMFCAVGIQSSNYSYEIFIHGGRHEAGSPTPDLDEVYILSLPAFQWFRANYISVHPRFGHTCHSTGNGQMVAIGGFDASYYHADIRDGRNDSADPWTQGIGVFDMTSLEWKNSYQANASRYALPDAIKRYYGQNASRYPSEWTSAGVRELFQHTPSRMSRGAIAGVVIGSVSSFLVVGYLAWRLWKWKWKGNWLAAQRAHGQKTPGNEFPMLDSIPMSEISAANRPCEVSNSQQLCEMDNLGQLFEISTAGELHQID